MKTYKTKYYDFILIFVKIWLQYYSINWFGSHTGKYIITGTYVASNNKLFFYNIRVYFNTIIISFAAYFYKILLYLSLQ